MQAYNDDLLIGLRDFAGLRRLGSESEFYELQYLEDGVAFRCKDRVETHLPVRHFVRDGDALWVGNNTAKEGITIMQKHIRKKGKYELKGEADRGMDVVCVAPLPDGKPRFKTRRKWASIIFGLTDKLNKSRLLCRFDLYVSTQSSRPRRSLSSAVRV